MVNFKKLEKGRKLSRRMKLHGMDISIETDKGELRHWYDVGAKKEGTTKMLYPYGYIRRTDGADGESVDCYIGPNKEATKVYVIRQNKAPDFQKYDEDKCMIAFNSAKEAKEAYLAHYNSPKFFDSMETIDIEDFKDMYIKKAVDMIPGGLADNKKIEDFDKEKIKEGIKVELEHTSSRDIAQEIAMDHLTEDPNYYKKLKKMEKNLNNMPPQDPNMIDPMAMVDPYDMENPESVEMNLNSIGSMGDKELERLVKEIWGKGYQYSIVSPNQMRAEIRGFLRDQSEYLQTIQPMMGVNQNSMPATPNLPHSSPSSQSSNENANHFEEGSNSQNLEEQGSANPSLVN